LIASTESFALSAVSNADGIPDSPIARRHRTILKSVAERKDKEVAADLWRIAMVKLPPFTP
jgi:hypothetical protein